MKTTIIIWGIGERTSIYLRHDYFREYEIKGFIDSRNYGGEFYGRRVWNPTGLPELMKDTDYLVIANYFIGEILEQCLKLGIDREKIVFTDEIVEPFIRVGKEKVLKLFPELCRDLELNRYKLIEMNEKDENDEQRRIGKGRFNHPSYMSDYFRYRSFEFAAEQIIQEDVTGAVAEFGVFRGNFSALINERFKDRRLYLFDTFEGFDKEEAARETVKGRCDERFSEFHSDTSVERMLANLPYPQKCVVCKGLFPQSVTQTAMNEIYAFVSIDVDFEESVYAGLEFFYPRLAENGVIYLHDYNSAFLSGVKVAVERYEEGLGERMKKIPLADRAGTLVIVK